MPVCDPPENNSPSTSIAERVTQVLREGSLAALATLIHTETTAGEIGAKLLLAQSGAAGSRTGSFGHPSLDDAVAERALTFLGSKADTIALYVREFAPSLTEWTGAQILFERIRQEPRLVICGAGHVGASLARLSALMGYRATLIDDRTEFVRRELFADELIDLVATESWSDAVREAVDDGRGVYVAIVTRGHSEDERCLRAIIDSGANYIGLIGSKRRTSIVLQRLRDSGAVRTKDRADFRAVTRT